jgi:hypothetical protein
MTICVSVKVGEGLVLAADSAVVLEGIFNTPVGPQQGILQNFEFANKVTHFKDYPIGVLNWGLGSINARSIQSLIMEFEYSYQSINDNTNYTVKQIADNLLDFIKTRYDAGFPTDPKPNLGILVGGYSANHFFPEKYVYEFPISKEFSLVRPDRPDGTPDFGANWFGMTDALIRLVLGFDPNAINELVNRGVNKAIVEQWVKDGVASLPLIFDGMPLQDAIDFAEYAIQVVIGRFRFGLGPPLCGGDIDIAVITPNAFRWARRKQWGIHHD